MTLADVAADAVALSVPGAPRLRLEPTSSAGRRLVAPLGRPVRGTAGPGPGHRQTTWAGHPAGSQRRRVGPHPRRLEVAGRIRRLGYFTSQPAALLTARCDNGQRVDLLVVPPGTARRLAEAAMALAATAGNRIHAPSLLAAARARPTLPETDGPGRTGLGQRRMPVRMNRFGPGRPAPRRSAGHEAKRPDKPQHNPHPEVAS